MSVYVAIHTSGSPSIGDVAEFGRLALALGAKPDGPLVTREGGNGALRCVLPTEVLEKLAEFASDRHFLEAFAELHVVASGAGGEKCNFCRLNDTWVDGKCTNCGKTAADEETKDD